ncbi:hypothetical protein EAG_06232 [Camponotus floridanus]|uniref:Uncharacterized protein n=1 Tax=Camponotus floridanus TaxID=104421 RepID=E2A618_CAMFO|nr:hypothetical protein EAG_06232 [Camponotus floridanus]
MRNDNPRVAAFLHTLECFQMAVRRLMIRGPKVLQVLRLWLAKLVSAPTYKAIPGVPSEKSRNLRWEFRPLANLEERPRDDILARGTPGRIVENDFLDDPTTDRCVNRAWTYVVEGNGTPGMATDKEHNGKLDAMRRMIWYQDESTWLFLAKDKALTCIIGNEPTIYNLHLQVLHKSVTLKLNKNFSLTDTDAQQRNVNIEATLSILRVRISWKLNNCSHLYPSRKGLRVDIAAVAGHHRRAWDKYLGSVFRLISIATSVRAALRGPVKSAKDNTKTLESECGHVVWCKSHRETRTAQTYVRGTDSQGDTGGWGKGGGRGEVVGANHAPSSSLSLDPSLPQGRSRRIYDLTFLRAPACTQSTCNSTPLQSRGDFSHPGAPSEPHLTSPYPDTDPIRSVSPISSRYVVRIRARICSGSGTTKTLRQSKLIELAAASLARRMKDDRVGLRSDTDSVAVARNTRRHQGDVSGDTSLKDALISHRARWAQRSRPPPPLPPLHVQGSHTPSAESLLELVFMNCMLSLRERGLPSSRYLFSPNFCPGAPGEKSTSDSGNAIREQKYPREMTVADNCGRVHGRLGRSEIRGRRRSKGTARGGRGGRGIVNEARRGDGESLTACDFSRDVMNSGPDVMSVIIIIRIVRNVENKYRKKDVEDVEEARISSVASDDFGDTSGAGRTPGMSHEGKGAGPTGVILSLRQIARKQPNDTGLNGLRSRLAELDIVFVACRSRGHTRHLDTVEIFMQNQSESRYETRSAWFVKDSKKLPASLSLVKKYNYSEMLSILHIPTYVLRYWRNDKASLFTQIRIMYYTKGIAASGVVVHSLISDSRTYYTDRSSCTWSHLLAVSITFKARMHALAINAHQSPYISGMRIVEDLFAKSRDDCRSPKLQSINHEKHLRTSLFSFHATIVCGSRDKREQEQHHKHNSDQRLGPYTRNEGKEEEKEKEEEGLVEGYDVLGLVRLFDVGREKSALYLTPNQLRSAVPDKSFPLLPLSFAIEQRAPNYFCRQLSVTAPQLQPYGNFCLTLKGGVLGSKTQKYAYRLLRTFDTRETPTDLPVKASAIASVYVRASAMEHLLNRYPGPLLSGPLSQAWIYRFQVPGIFHRAPTFQATHLPAPLFAKYHRMEDNAMNEDRIKIADEYPRYGQARPPRSGDGTAPDSGRYVRTRLVAAASDNLSHHYRLTATTLPLQWRGRLRDVSTDNLVAELASPDEPTRSPLPITILITAHGRKEDEDDKDDNDDDDDEDEEERQAKLARKKKKKKNNNNDETNIRRREECRMLDNDRKMDKFPFTLLSTF